MNVYIKKIESNFQRGPCSRLDDIKAIKINIYLNYFFLQLKYKNR